MSREDHQPQEESPKRPKRTGDERRAACGRMIAFVLVRDDAGAELAASAVDTAVAAKVAAVFVLAAPGQEAKVAQGVYSVRRKGGGTMVQVLGYDPRAALPATRDAANFELLGLPYGFIQTARAVAASSLEDYAALIVMDASMSEVTADHLYELCRDLEEQPGLDAVASWVQWLRRPPFLLSRAFLEGLDASGLIEAGPQGDRPVPQLRVHDHVFGEEKLAVPVPAPAAVGEFLDGCTMSALQAVRLAKWAKEHPGEEPVSPNQPRSLEGLSEPQPLGSADKLLFDAALEAVERGSARAGASLDWADSFGRRNRLDFPLLNDRAHVESLVYLDSAATAQRAGMALDAQADFDAHGNANVYRGAYGLSAQATFAFNDARKKLESFIGAERRSTVYCANTSAACALVAQAWGEHHIGEGDLIVTTIAEHHSNMLPFALLAERKGASVEYLPLGPDGRIDQEAYRSALARGPKLVAIAHIGNVMGLEAPVAEMAAAAHEAKARFLLDAAQSFPHVKVGVSELGVDWLAFSGHKAYGPMGIGGLWASPEAFAEMDPLVAGGGTVSHVAAGSYYLRSKSIQYELGTPPVSQAIGLAAAVGYLDGLGMENVARHAAVFTDYLVEGLHELDGVTVAGDHSQPDGKHGLVSFTVRSVAPSPLASFLGKLGVCIRAGGHCALPLHASMGLVGTGRISLAVHTTRDDLDAALAAISLCRMLYEI